MTGSKEPSALDRLFAILQTASGRACISEDAWADEGTVVDRAIKEVASMRDKLHVQALDIAMSKLQYPDVTPEVALEQLRVMAESLPEVKALYLRVTMLELLLRGAMYSLEEWRDIRNGQSREIPSNGPSIDSDIADFQAALGFGSPGFAISLDPETWAFVRTPV